jgi:hypothetical protein
MINQIVIIIWKDVDMELVLLIETESKQFTFDKTFEILLV